MSSTNTTTTKTATTSPMTTNAASTPTITATAPVSITINANTSDSTTFNTSLTETDNGTAVFETTLSFTVQSTSEEGDEESSFPLVPVIPAAVMGSVLLVFCILFLVVLIRRWYNKAHPPPPLPVLDPHGLIKHNSLGRRPPNPHLPLPVNPLPDPTPTPTHTSFTGASARESGDRNVYANIDDKHCSIGTDVLPANDRPDSLPPFAPPPPPSSPTSPVSAQAGPGTFESVYIPMDLTNPQNPARVPERDPEVGAEAEVVYTAPDLQPPPPCLPSSSGYVNVPGPDPQDQQQQQQQQQDGQGTGAGHYQNLSPTDNNYSNVFPLGPPPPDSGDGAGGAAAAKMASPEKVAATLRSDPPALVKLPPALVKLPPVPSCKTASGTSPQSSTRRSPLAQAKPANQASKTTPKPSPKPSPKPRPTVAHKLQESPRMQMSRLLAAQASKEAEGKTREEGGSDSDSENYENLKDQKKNKNAFNNILKPSPKGRGQVIANGSGPPPTEAETSAPPWVKQKKTKTTAKAVVLVARAGTSDGRDSELMQKLARRRRDES